jgi:hypothetical protein
MTNFQSPGEIIKRENSQWNLVSRLSFVSVCPRGNNVQPFLVIFERKQYVASAVLKG